MTIDVINNEIIIKDGIESLDSILTSQILFWDFKYRSFSYVAPYSNELLIKISNYLSSESIPYTLTKKANLTLTQIQSDNSKFTDIKNIAAQYKDGIYNTSEFEKFKEFTFNNLKRTLKIHQLKAAFHLYIIKNGANFSVPGSGKTSVVLAVYEKLRLENKVNALFVVGPPASFGPWKEEFSQTLTRHPKTIILAGGNKSLRKERYYNLPNGDIELYLTTYQTFLSDRKELGYFFKQRHNKIFFVIDEAHYIKQINGNWAQAILSHSEKAAIRCVLTGTPMPKNYSDVYNLFDFLWPNNNPITNTNKLKINTLEKKGALMEAKHILQMEIGPLFYRVRKTDLNLMAQNFVKPYLIKMGKNERLIYDAIFNKIRNYSKDNYINNIGLINNLLRGRMIRLRQSVSYSKLLTSAIEDYKEILIEDDLNLKYLIQNYDKLEVPGKIKKLISLILRLNKKEEKVIIWSNFIETIKLIEKHLKSNQIFCKKIYGATPIHQTTYSELETREKIISDFQDPKNKLNVLIANPAACAESISLHKSCNNAVYYDLSYNCAQYLQSLDRIHRVGGSEFITPNYFFLQYSDTIDIDIKNNLDKKTKKMFEIIENDYAIYSLDMFEDDGDLEAYDRIFNKSRKEHSKNDKAK